MQRAEIVNMLEEKFDRGDYMRYTVWNSMILTRLWNYVDRPFVHKYLGKLIPTMKIKTGLLIFTLLFEDLIRTKSPAKKLKCIKMKKGGIRQYHVIYENINVMYIINLTIAVFVFMMKNLSLTNIIILQIWLLTSTDTPVLS